MKSAKEVSLLGSGFKLNVNVYLCHSWNQRRKQAWVEKHMIAMLDIYFMGQWDMQVEIPSRQMTIQN